MQSASMATNSIILLLVLSISCLCSTRDVYIQPSEGEHCPGTCYNVTTFGKIAKNFSNSSGLIVHFLEGTHLLNLQELVVFTNLTNAVFEGDGRMEQGLHETVWQSTVVIKCTEHSSTGIAFVDSSNITFRYITITNCGAYMTEDSYFAYNRSINASLGYLSVSKSIVIDHVSVQNGSWNGLLVMADGADLSIINSSFAQNVIRDNSNIVANVLIVYTDPLNCEPQKYVYNTLIANTNISHLPFHSSLIPSFGLAIEIIQLSYRVTIVLDSVIAYSNNGYGNVWISSINIPNYNLTINNSQTFDTYGFGLLVTNIPDQITHHNCFANGTNSITSIFITNSKFVYIKGRLNECIGFGFQGMNYPVRIRIESTEISHNVVNQSALYIVCYAYQSQVNIALQNVTINNNSLLQNDFNSNKSTSQQASAVRAEFVSGLVLNNVSITNNNATGLLAYRTTVVVNGTAVFYNNTGIDGGGLAMYGESYLVFGENSLLNFSNNKAKKRGGAIFVYRLLPNSPCFYQYSEDTQPQTTRATFSGNNAKIAGTVLFGSDKYCIHFTNPHNHTIDYFSVTFNYSTQTGPSVISSEPTDVYFCDDNNTINCSQTQLTMPAYPGEEINISVVTVGQLNGVAPGVIKIQPLGNASAPAEVYHTIAMNCKTIVFTPIDVSYSLTIFDGTGSNSVILNIEKSDCPLGFQISKTGVCDCKELKCKATNTTSIKCNAATNTISRQGDVWIGNISDCVVVYSPCPLDYCKLTNAKFSLTDPDPQCALNRTGILCGSCQDGLSLALGSNNCIQCPQFSYLALIIPFAAAGFGLVALLMILNLTVSIGTINGLIFYASIVKISESTGIFFPNGSIPVLSQFIAWLNLDLGIETCFYHGMTAYAKVWLQFVFPLYIWFIIATIIVLCRYSTWLSNKIGGNVVQVLATLILLSFTKIFRTFAPALTAITLPCKNENAVWYVDGNVPYFSLKHYILMAAAVLFLLLAVPYTLALLFDAVIEKYLTRLLFFRRQWVKFKPFVDAYHGPYKDNCRFWTGLLLLVRMAFTLASLHLGTDATLVFITTSTSVLLSLMVFFGGIYQKSSLNILECLSLLNLALLSATYNPWYDSVNDAQIVTVISVSVAIAMFIGVLVYHIFLRVKNFKCFKKLAINKFNRTNSEESERLLEDEDYVYKRPIAIEPTSTDVWMKRESLIYS